MPGLGSAHLLQGAQPAAMTNEQRIRGADQGIDSAVIVTGYDGDLVSAYAAGLCASSELTGHGAREVKCAMYSTNYTLARSEIDA
jgi:hypothetical protein